MRLVSYSRNGEEGYGYVDGSGGVIACRALLGGSTPSLRSVLVSGALERLRDAAADRAPDFALSEVQLLPPIPDPGKILCVGVNFTEHRDEGRHQKPSHPTVFTRFADSVVGHLRPVVRPTQSQKLDYEGELAVVIGKPAHAVTAQDATKVIAGYTCFNDFSVRDWQRHSTQWVPGKNFFGVGSAGPWLVTADEVVDPQSLKLETRVNGDLRQAAWIRDMIFPISELISYISSFTPLAPGDLVVTGTPGGVGQYRKPPQFLAPGDNVDVEISGVGLLRNLVDIGPAG